ncbi:uncharacterized protein DEA37_0012896 [Paragonimus westermani]|uniref:Integrase zinc-binding domain-containing protein n=1 Tax=Paragonimus westermani TaxID=34504 RepID=A0A5J4NJ88_9TREM|nr:uncharacterized protein DEA37_0012896 [Paragonimus westermani]
MERLRSTSLKLRGSKCHFLQRQVTFLSHVIAADGIKTDPAKSEQIKGWPRLQTVENVRSFLGLTSYYRNFIHGFTEIAAALHRLTDKGRPFTRSGECSASFETPKEKLTTPPMLTFPDVSEEAGEFVLDTDASDVSTGAVLSQETPEDHQSLQWLRNFRDPEGQVVRWRERLQECDFACVYRRGARHGNVDALSRVTAPSEVNATLWAEDHLSDSYAANIYKRQADGLSKPSAIQMRQNPFDERHYGSGPKLITPKLEVAAVLQKIHTELGHAGQLKTEAAIRQRYWWPGIHADVVTHCLSRENYSASKNHTPSPRAPPEAVITEHLGQRVGADIVGRVPVTKRGNGYILVLVD